MKPIFFTTPEDFRKWLEKNHDKEKEVFVGYYKTSSGKLSITWPQSVDEALCFGWIDGVRKSLGETSYMIRFIPRKKGSIWSSVNVKRVGELTKMGRMQPSGLNVFIERDQKKSGLYSYEQRIGAKLPALYEKQFRANKKAWEHFQGMAPSYQKPAIWWVISAKQEGTKLKRLAQLIESSEQGKKVPPLTRPSEKEK